MIKHSQMLGNGSKQAEAMRLDKWLWCARFYKTRGAAVEAVNAGKVKLDGEKVKPSRAVIPGEIYTVKRGPYTQTITVRALSPRRVPAAEAANLYEESRESVQAREALKEQLKIDNAMHPRAKGRPSKRERRKLIRFRQDLDNP